MENSQDFLQKWEKENNSFYPNEMRWNRAIVNKMLAEYEKTKKVKIKDKHHMAEIFKRKSYKTVISKISLKKNELLWVAITDMDSMTQSMTQDIHEGVMQSIPKKWRKRIVIVIGNNKLKFVKIAK